MKSVLRLARSFGFFLLYACFFVGFCVADSITEKRGRFFCTKDGKLLVNVNAPTNKIVCIIGDKTYNAVDGSLVKDESRASINSARINAGLQDEPPASGARSISGRKKKKTTIVNNYYSKDEEQEVKQSPKHTEDKHSKNYPVIKRDRKATFTGFFVGTFYGYLDTSINQTNTFYETDYFTGDRHIVGRSTLDSEFGNHAFGFLGGFNFQPHKNIMLGLEGGGYVIGESSFRVPSGAAGNYVNQIRDLAFVMGRIGTVIANSFNIYLGAGFGVSNIYEKSSPPVGAFTGNWGDTSYARVYPKFMAGFEWLVLGHVSLRLQYELSIFVNTAAHYSDLNTVNKPEAYFDYDGLRNEFKLILSYKF